MSAWFRHKGQCAMRGADSRPTGAESKETVWGPALVQICANPIQSPPAIACDMGVARAPKIAMSKANHTTRGWRISLQNAVDDIRVDG